MQESQDLQGFFYPSPPPPHIFVATALQQLQYFYKEVDFNSLICKGVSSVCSFQRKNGNLKVAFTIIHVWN